MTLYRLSRCYMSYEQTKSLDPNVQQLIVDSGLGANHSRKLRSGIICTGIKENQKPISAKESNLRRTRGEGTIKQRLEKLGIERERRYSKRPMTKIHLNCSNVDVALDRSLRRSNYYCRSNMDGSACYLLSGEGMVGRLSASILEGQD